MASLSLQELKTRANLCGLETSRSKSTLVKHLSAIRDRLYEERTPFIKTNDCTCKHLMTSAKDNFVTTLTKLESKFAQTCKYRFKLIGHDPIS